MEYEREELRRRREYEQALAAQKKLEEKLAELKRAARSAKGRLLATTRSETWHRMSLGWLDREAGYTGEMASARLWLRSQPLRTYMNVMVRLAENMPGANNLEIEVAAVTANLEDWTAKGDALLLERAKRNYAAEMASFAAWQRENPGQDGWRRKSATRAQNFLLARIGLALGLEPPLRMNRGDAHDWITSHGGNPRLASRADAPSIIPADQGNGTTTAAPAQDGDAA